MLDQSDWRVVRSTALFGTMSQEIADKIIGTQSVRVFEKGIVLFHQGEPANAFYVLLDGWVKIYRITPDGSEAVVGVFRRGETFAEAVIFLGGRYPVTAEVVTTSRLLRIDGDVLRRRINEQRHAECQQCHALLRTPCLDRAMYRNRRGQGEMSRLFLLRNLSG